MMKTSFVRWICLFIWIALALLWYTNWKRTSSSQISLQNFDKSQHVYDFASILPTQDLHRFEWYMNLIMRESDIDVRFVFVKGTEGKTLERLATDLVEKLHIGGKTRDRRGLLLLYDTKSKRLKVEVGYGLEEFFPDSFIGYLVDRHARMFFESGSNESLGLRFLLRILHNRIREAILGETFNPRVLDALPSTGYLSGGAGVNKAMQTTGDRNSSSKTRLSETERERYQAQDSPEATFLCYMEWLSQPVFDPNVDLFTEATRQYLSGLPMSPAYHDFILFGEFDQPYQVVERNDSAILYFTRTPFVSPHLFVKEKNRWRMDIIAEIQNTKEITGGIYTWTLVKNKTYTNTFADLLINIQNNLHFQNYDNQVVSVQGYIRVKHGDNRVLANRGSKNL